MKRLLLILIPVAVILFSACNEQTNKTQEPNEAETENIVHISPLENLKSVDNLLSKLAKEPQKFSVPSNIESDIKGEEGTIIHVDPSRLETTDGSALGKTIDIELLEMTDNSSLILQNAPTVSDDKLLITGGAYYINMSSDGKPLKIKGSKGLKVEFPKLTENEMSLFLGERDELGQINWKEANKSFQGKSLSPPVLSNEPKPDTKKSETESKDAFDKLFGYIDSEEQRKELTEKQKKQRAEAKKRYEKEVAEYQDRMKTYEAIEILNFGWINCDRFYNDTRPQVDINLLCKSDSVKGARFFAIFENIKSIMSANYTRGQQDKTGFARIPKGEKIKILGLTIINETPYAFEQSLEAKKTTIEVNFTATSEDKIIGLMELARRSEINDSLSQYFE